MPATDAQFILFVKDIERSKTFYEKVFNAGSFNDEQGYLEMKVSESLTIGIVSESEIVKILGTKVPHPMIANGIPRSEMYLKVDDPEKFYERALSAGAISISKYKKRHRGNPSAYVMDPDGHILAFAQRST